MPEDTWHQAQAHAARPLITVVTAFHVNVHHHSTSCGPQLVVFARLNIHSFIFPICEHIMPTLMYYPHCIFYYSLCIVISCSIAFWQLINKRICMYVCMATNYGQLYRWWLQSNRLLWVELSHVFVRTDLTHLAILHMYLLLRELESSTKFSYRPSVLTSVRPSHGCIIQKRLKLGLWNFHLTVAHFV